MLYVTASDDRYYNYLLMQIVATHTNFNTYPIVYDLGMTDAQLGVLEIMGVQVDTCGPGPEAAKEYPGTYKPMALFKPDLLLDVCNKYPTEDIVYLDADAAPIRAFKFPVTFIGVTAVSEAIIEAYVGTDMEPYVGPFHSGVIFLGVSDERIAFLEEWRNDIFADAKPSDKKSLNRILYNYTPEVLSEEKFNSRVALPYTRILHLQGPKR